MSGAYSQRPMRKLDDVPVHDGSSRELIEADGIPEADLDRLFAEATCRDDEPRPDKDDD